MKSLTTIVLLICYSQLYSQDSSKYVIYFENNSTEIKETEIDKISGLLGAIQTIELEGHTDNQGDITFNLKLSQKRVQVVKNLLLALGIKNEQIQSSFFGESKPLNDNSTEEEKAINRRVDMIFYYTSKFQENNEISAIQQPKDESVKIEPEEYSYAIHPILSKLKKEQNFRISNKQDTALKTQDGTILYFPKHCFESNCDSIDIVITDLNTPKANIINNVTTVSNGRLIYSVGMYDIQAKCNNQKVNLKPYKKYTVLFPINNPNENEKVLGFYGVRDSITQAVNWIASSNRPLEIVNGGNFWSCGTKPEKYCWLTSWLVNSEKRLRRERDIATYKKRKEIHAKYKQLEPNKLDAITQSDLNYYVFQPRKMGLVNVDIFWKMDEENMINQQFFTNENLTDGIELKMVFKRRRSILPAALKTNKHFEFKDIPAGEKVIIVGLKRTKEKIKLILEEVITGAESVNLEFEEITSFQELDERLELIN